MVFDEELRVYRIVDLPEHFYSAGNYYRFVDGYWQSARSPAGPWVETPQNRLPPSLTQAPSLTQGAPTS
jgi:hypothetical protein